MDVIVRIVALWVALVAVIAPIRLALIVASMQPFRPVQLAFLMPFVLAGLALSSGYIGLAAFPRIFARTGYAVRVIGTVVLLGTALTAIFLFHAISTFFEAQAVRVGLSLLVCASVAVGSVWLLLATVWTGWLYSPRSSIPGAIKASYPPDKGT